LTIELLASRNVLVKVNSVMIPGINDTHLIEVNKVVKSKGVFLHNIMPLISAAAHGTYYGLNGQRGPTASELKALQDKLSDGTKLMRHCRQWRADAVGLLGRAGGRTSPWSTWPETVAYDPGQREAYRATVAIDRGEHLAIRKAVNVTFSPRGEGRINRRFGHAQEFQIYEITAKGVTFIGQRKVDHYCEGGWGDAAALEDVIAALEGVSGVLCSKIGTGPKDALSAAGITATDDDAHEWIEAGISAWYAKNFSRESSPTPQQGHLETANPALQK
jgi:nitrogen fixation protein NifB